MIAFDQGEAEAARGWAISDERTAPFDSGQASSGIVEVQCQSA